MPEFFLLSPTHAKMWLVFIFFNTETANIHSTGIKNLSVGKTAIAHNFMLSERHWLTGGN